MLRGGCCREGVLARVHVVRVRVRVRVRVSMCTQYWSGRCVTLSPTYLPISPHISPYLPISPCQVIDAVARFSRLYQVRVRVRVSVRVRVTVTVRARLS